MTKQEAIYLLNNLRAFAEEDDDPAIDMAIEALQDDMEVRINLNEKVKFKLSDFGKEIYRHRYDKYGFKYNRELRLDDDGYMSMQLWDFMNIFGECMILGAPEVVNPLEIIYERRMNNDG